MPSYHLWFAASSNAQPDASVSEEMIKCRQDTVTWMMKADLLERKTEELAAELERLKSAHNAAAAAAASSASTAAPPAADVLESSKAATAAAHREAQAAKQAQQKLSRELDAMRAKCMEADGKVADFKVRLAVLEREREDHLAAIAAANAKAAEAAAVAASAKASSDGGKGPQSAPVAGANPAGAAKISVVNVAETDANAAAAAVSSLQVRFAFRSDWILSIIGIHY